MNCEIQAKEEMMFMMLMAQALAQETQPEGSISSVSSGLGSGQAAAAERICRMARTM